MRYSKGNYSLTPNTEELKGQPSSVLSVFFWLCYHADGDGICFPSRSVLTKEANLSMKTVDRAIKTLINKGFITKTIRKNGIENTSNLYQINLLGGRGGSPIVTLGSPTSATVTIPIELKEYTEKEFSEISSLKEIPNITSNSKKQRMNKYNERNSSDSDEPSIDLDSRELTDPNKAEKGGIDKYKAMMAWATERRGFPFSTHLKQYKAFKMAKESDISPARLKERWIDFESDAFRKKVGWDWMDVVTSFNKKQ